jgi:hypothetical protein
MYPPRPPVPLTGMRLYADFDLLTSESRPSGVAYALLRQAGHRPSVEYVAGGGVRLAQLAGRPRPPVLVTDTGDVLSSLPDILDWIARTAGPR